MMKSDNEDLRFALLKHDIRLFSIKGIITNREREYLCQEARNVGIKWDEVERLIDTALTETGHAEVEEVEWCHHQGLEFEKYIISRLCSHYKLIHWTCDKCYEDKTGNKHMDADITNPDLQFSATSDSNVPAFAIECKWHSEESSEKEKLRIAQGKCQLNRYREFRQQKNIPVFIAVGIGRTGKEIKELYILNIDELEGDKNHVTSEMRVSHLVSLKSSLKFLPRKQKLR